MRILFVADGRSPIALNWIGHFVKTGHEVHLVSTFACQPELPLASLEIIPVAFSGLKKQAQADAVRTPEASIWGAAALGFRSAVRHWLGTFTLPSAGKRLRELAQRIQPDFVHAMRIPYEGMLASYANLGVPLILSIWGNDFTLHARSNTFMSAATRRTLAAADALHTDCQRDQRLARHWGFMPEKPHIVLPSGAGIQTDIFYPPQNQLQDQVVINPRGFRAYVRSDTFFKSIPTVLKMQPSARFICPAMYGEPKAHQWVDDLMIAKSVELLPSMPRSQMAELYRQAQVLVSVTNHDGTPNTLLEGMASGCFPICGDLESIREWIDPGVNGMLIDSNDPQALADAVLKALGNEELRSRAQQHNLALIATKAEHNQVMRSAEKFYHSII